MITDLLDVLGAVCLMLGAFLCLAAAVGLARFPDVLSRMHAATKPQTLGLILVVTGLELSLRSWAAFGTVLLIASLQFMTAPVAAHLVSRTVYRSNQVRRDLLDRDDLADDRWLGRISHPVAVSPALGSSPRRPLGQSEGRVPLVVTLSPPTTATGQRDPWMTANAVEPGIIIRGCPLPLDPITSRPASVEAFTRVSSGTPSSTRLMTVSPGCVSATDADVRSRISAAARRRSSCRTTGTVSSPVQQITSI